MLGALINFAAILAGATVGVFFRGGIPERFRIHIMQGLALCVMLIGIRGAIGAQDLLVVIFCMVLGGVLGEALDIEKRLQHLGDRAQKAFGGKQQSGSTFAQGFVTASLVYCIGAMAIVGALDSGLKGDHTTQIAKAMLDGLSAVIFASTLGPGVALSAVPVLIYQGGITLLSGLIAPWLTDGVIAEMSAVGGLLILAIGLNLLGVTKIRIGNFLPAVFLPLLISPAFLWLNTLLGK